MNISRIETFIVSVPLVTPFKTALRTVSVVQDLIVKITSSCGAVGYGEAPATHVITGDSLGSIWFAIEQVFKPRLLGQDIRLFQSLLGQLHSAMVGNNSAKAALEIALFDLRAQLMQQPLCALLGQQADTLQTDITISMNDAEQMVRDSLAAVAAGYQQLKLKIGSDPKLDVERVIEVARAVPDTIALRLDANQGWSAKQAIYALRQIEQAGVLAELVEQPVAATDIAGLKAVRDAVLTPVMADESAFDVQQVIQLLQMQAADIINIKLMKTAGISQALQIADLCAAAHVACMMGSMLESSVSVSAAAHVAASRPAVFRYLDLDGPTLCQFDPAEGGSRFSGPLIELNQNPGLGIQQIKGLQSAAEYFTALAKG